MLLLIHSMEVYGSIILKSLPQSNLTHKPVNFNLTENSFIHSEL